MVCQADGFVNRIGNLLSARAVEIAGTLGLVDHPHHFDGVVQIDRERLAASDRCKQLLPDIRRGRGDLADLFHPGHVLGFFMLARLDLHMVGTRRMPLAAGRAGISGDFRKLDLRVQILQVDVVIAGRQGALGTKNVVHRFTQRRCAGNLQVDQQPAGPDDAELHVVLRIADGCDALKIGGDFLEPSAHELQRVVNNVRAPVEQLPAAKSLERLPVAPELIVQPAELDLEHLANNAAGEKLANLHEARLETTVVTDEQPAGRLAIRDASQLAGVFVGRGDGLFEEDVLAGLQCCLGVGKVVARPRGDGDHLDVGVGDQLADRRIGRLIVTFGEVLATELDGVAPGNDLEHLGVAVQFIALHGPSGPAQADNADADRLVTTFACTLLGGGLLGHGEYHRSKQRLMSVAPGIAGGTRVGLVRVGEVFPAQQCQLVPHQQMRGRHVVVHVDHHHRVVGMLNHQRINKVHIDLGPQEQFENMGQGVVFIEHGQEDGAFGEGELVVLQHGPGLVGVGEHRTHNGPVATVDNRQAKQIKALLGGEVKEVLELADPVGKEDTELNAKRLFVSTHGFATGHGEDYRSAPEFCQGQIRFIGPQPQAAGNALSNHASSADNTRHDVL